MQREKMGIMGGTFDPIHYGHLVTAEAARHTFSLAQVVFVPTGRPPHKPEEVVTDAEHRYLMTVLATIENPFFTASRMEIDRPGYSYTIDTVREFKEMFGPRCHLYFITGADAILEIFTWRNPEGLLDSCSFIAATRPGYSPAQLSSLVSSLQRQDGPQIEFLEVPALAISSSDIRMRVREGRPIKYLVPEAVEYYIIKNGLYRTGAKKESEVR